MSRNFSLVLTVLLTAALLSACMVPGAAESPSPSVGIPTPAPTAAPPRNSEAPEIPAKSAPFGRYAAATVEGLYYVQADSIAFLRSNESESEKLFDLHKTGIVEDLYAVSEGNLYFTMILDPTQKKPGADRALVHALLSSGVYTLSTVAAIKGPMLAQDGLIYFIENGSLVCYDCQSENRTEIKPLGAKAELFSWGFFDGKALCYSVFDEMEEDGTLYGPGTLYRLDIAQKKATLVGERNRPHAEAFLFGQSGVLYALTPNNEGYALRILGSEAGPDDTDYAIPQAILPNGPGTERIYTDDSSICLITAQSDESAHTKIAAYRFERGGSPISELWAVELPDNISCYEIDRFAQTLAVLTEGNESTNPVLYRLNLSDGKIVNQTTLSGLGTQTKTLVAMPGKILVYSMSGEDHPVPSLVYSE